MFLEAILDDEIRTADTKEKINKLFDKIEDTIKPMAQY